MNWKKIKLTFFAIILSTMVVYGQEILTADQAHQRYLKNHSTNVKRTLERIEKYAEAGRTSMKCCYYTFNEKHAKIFRELGYKVTPIKHKEGYRYWEPEKYYISW